MQKKLPLINSAHGPETRNIINELIKLFNGMGYTYDEALQKAHDILDEAQQTNDMNESVQRQINTLIAESGTSDAEVLQARIDAEGNEYPVLKERLDESDAQLAQTQNRLDDFNLEHDFSFVKDTFEGNSDTTKYYAQFMDGLRIENIGENELFFEIDDVRIKVAPMQGYTGMFPLFKKVKVYATSNFRAEVRGKLNAPYKIELFDYFNRPDSETELGVSDSGQYYLIDDDLGENNYPIGINDGKARSPTVMSTATFGMLRASSDNYHVEADIYLRELYSGASGLIFNYKNYTNLFIIRGHDGGTIRLMKKDGSYSTLATSDVVYNTPKTVRLGVQRDERNIKIYADGEIIIDYTLNESESNKFNGVYHGFLLKLNGTADNLKIIY